MSPKVRIRVKNGTATISTEGFHGDKCLSSTESLKALLGPAEGPPTLTNEYYTDVELELEEEAD